MKAPRRASPLNRWRHARQWFSYELRDSDARGRWLRLWFAPRDAGRRFDVVVNDRVLASLLLEKRPPTEGQLYSLDLPRPLTCRAMRAGKLRVKFVAQPGSMAGGLYGLRLLSALPRFDCTMSLTSLRFRPLLLAALLASSFATHAATPPALMPWARPPASPCPLRPA